MASLILQIVVILCLFESRLVFGGKACSRENTVLFVPLDERFTTRDIVLNLNDVTDYCMVTPDPSLISLWKQPAPMGELHAWVEDNIALADTAIISAEMYLYGSLINSRISNDTTAEITGRVHKLVDLSKQHGTKLYVSTVVMRIPSYNGDFEEPWYWTDYGADLYGYSYNTDEAEKTGSAEAAETAVEFKKKVPANALEEFVWRRERNHNVTLELIEVLRKEDALEYLYITLDDSAPYGFNIREGDELKALVGGLSEDLQERMPVYPGSDETQMILFSKYATVAKAASRGGEKRVRVGVVYRDPATKDRIPNYEGEGMATTLQMNIQAGGGELVELADVDDENAGSVDLLLFVNNFSTDKQAEASQQPPYNGDVFDSSDDDGDDDGSEKDYARFDAFIAKYVDKRVLGFCDNRYSNGADLRFVAYLTDRVAQTRLRTVAYAGWNTNSNTIGTVVANAIILSLFGEAGQAQEGNAHFNSIRLVEDAGYQSDTRLNLIQYLSTLSPQLFPDENTMDLNPDLAFYTRFSYKQLASTFSRIAETYGLPYQLDSIYYPWNRTFESGFQVSLTAV
jgi:hypothetical protein